MAGLERRDRLRVALLFTAFEAGMPIAGMLIGRAAGSFLGAWAGYGGIAFLILAGALLLRPGQKESDEAGRLRLLAHTRGLAILDLGLSISVDELTIGLSAGLLGLSILLTVAWIGVQAFVATQVKKEVVQSRAMKQFFMASQQRRPYLFPLCWCIPVRSCCHSAGVGCKTQKE